MDTGLKEGLEMEAFIDEHWGWSVQEAISAGWSSSSLNGRIKVSAGGEGKDGRSPQGFFRWQEAVKGERGVKCQSKDAGVSGWGQVLCRSGEAFWAEDDDDDDDEETPQFDL